MYHAKKVLKKNFSIIWIFENFSFFDTIVGLWYNNISYAPFPQVTTI